MARKETINLSFNFMKVRTAKHQLPVRVDAADLMEENIILFR
jgi:hypothetical protein